MGASMQYIRFGLSQSMTTMGYSEDMTWNSTGPHPRNNNADMLPHHST